MASCSFFCDIAWVAAFRTSRRGAASGGVVVSDASTCKGPFPKERSMHPLPVLALIQLT